MKGIVTETDNRDDTTTTLKVVVQDRIGTICYVDVYPVELYLNMVKNCYEGRGNDTEVDFSDLQSMVDHLNQVLNEQY